MNATTTNVSPLLKVNDVARILGVSSRYVWKLISGEKLTVHRIGKSVRVSHDDLQRFLDLHRDCR